METVGGGVRTHVLQLLKNLDPERYELTLIYGERYDHVFESQREELAKHVTLILDSNLVFRWPSGELESGEIPTGYIAPHQAGYCALP